MSATPPQDIADDIPDTPQLYLITPPDLHLSSFPGQLARIMDSVEIACLRLSLAASDEGTVSRAADMLREIAHARDVPVMLDTHYRLVEPLGLDGVHLRDGARSVRYVRKQLGDADVMIGAFCGASRHEGMNAGESGVDYVSLGPITDTGLGDGQLAPFEDFEWWSEMIELPVVAEGALDLATVEALAPVTDFFAIGDEIWSAEDPLAALQALTAPLRG